MSFADIESGRARPRRAASNSADSAFQTLQQSLSLQVFKINANVQGILKLVDQLGTGRDSAGLRKSLCVHSAGRVGRHADLRRQARPDGDDADAGKVGLGRPEEARESAGSARANLFRRGPACRP
jgi:hypothetical protein